MNQYTQLLIYLKKLSTEHPLVNTVTKGNVDKLDLEKGNIYPLMHIDINSGSINGGGTVKFNVSLQCVSQRDLNKEVKSDKFWDNDNEVDNHNETFVILNEIWTKLHRDFEDKDIVAVDDSVNAEKIEWSGGNILDGWGIEFEVTLPNVTLDLCL